MGIEQGTAVSGSIFELPPIADLTDPRLPRAFKGWNQFRLNHAQQIEEIGSIQPMEVVSLARELSSTISKAIGVGAEKDGFSAISEEKMLQLTNIVSGKGNRIVFMRHGEQSPPEWISLLSNPALRKIRMMQDPFNRQDLLTNNGLIDVFVTALALLHVQVATGKRTRIFSSENLRAKEAAYIISIVIPGSGLAILEGLNCITYKNELDQPPVTEEQLLTDLPSGMMPWNPHLVDKLCKRSKSGLSQSEAIISTIGGLVDYGDRKNGNKLAIVLTHSQQLAEVLRLAGKLQDPSTRFPELTMIAMNNPNEVLVLNEGILGGDTHPRKKSMRKILATLGKGYEWYRIRRAEYATDQQIPFLVSPEPLFLSAKEGEEILRIGKDAIDFMHAADELYRSEEEVKQLLDRGKPEILQQRKEAQYLFLRPDLLITKEGFSICELETSPFGLALAELLNRAYRAAGFNTMVEDGVLQEFIVNNTSPQGVIAYSDKTSSYTGQLEFLAKEIFSGRDRKWRAEHAANLLAENNTNIYRGFYQHEFTYDLFVNNLVQTLLDNPQIEVSPSLTPHMEEKALLALIWDSRWELFLTRQLGEATLTHLREVVPPTWIIGQEKFFTLGLPQGLTSSEGLADISKSKRNFVLKRSGFGSNSSWGEGVSFLHEKSATQARSLLVRASQDSQALYVIQEFKASKEYPMAYDKDGHNIEQMQARIRLTPYFSMKGEKQGQLIAMKATGCEGTNYIHASTGSINTAVALA